MNLYLYLFISTGLTSWFLNPFPVSQPAPFSFPPGYEASSPPAFCRSPALCKPDAWRPLWSHVIRAMVASAIILFLPSEFAQNVFLHRLLCLFFGLSYLLLPHFLSNLRLFLHLREALAAHLLSTQTFLCSELKCQKLIGDCTPIRSDEELFYKSLILTVYKEQPITSWF